MASIFNLQILQENSYQENNFKTNKLLKGNKPKQFTKTKDVITYLNTLQTIYSHCIYVRNHIINYCKNKRFEKFIKEYERVIIMLSLADHKFDNRFNLNKNLLHFRELFNDIKESVNNDKIKTDMHKSLDIIKNTTKKLQSKALDEKQCEYFQSNIRKFQDDLFKKVKKIVNDYNKTSQKLLECDHLNKHESKIIGKKSITSVTLKHSILYYGFVINYKNILELNYIVSSITNMLNEEEFKSKMNI